MLIYWLMFALPAMMALIEQFDERRRGQFSFVWLFTLLALAVLIGFRWDTGGDWGNYARMVEQALWQPKPITPMSDPAFTLLTDYAARTRYGMLVVTAVSGALMAVALVRFCMAQPRPWLCLAVAVPYLVVVMGMGYIRQGMAISFLLMGLISLRRGNVLRYSLWVAAGALFHSTALILLPLGMLVVDHNLYLRALVAVLSLGGLGYAIISAHADTYVSNYVVAEMSSSGAAVRLFMTALPGAIFLIWRDRFELAAVERQLWSALSLASILAFVLLFVSRSSTVVDRVGLYLLPVQCFVYARVPVALAKDERAEKAMTIGILLLYAAALFVWLNFAVNVDYWLPYRFYFLEDGICLEC